MHTVTHVAARPPGSRPVWPSTSTRALTIYRPSVQKPAPIFSLLSDPFAATTVPRNLKSLEASHLTCPRALPQGHCLHPRNGSFPFGQHQRKALPLPLSPPAMLLLRKLLLNYGALSTLHTVFPQRRSRNRELIHNWLSTHNLWLTSSLLFLHACPSLLVYRCTSSASGKRKMTSCIARVLCVGDSPGVWHEPIGALLRGQGSANSIARFMDASGRGWPFYLSH